jgi:hypothetical protein
MGFWANTLSNFVGGLAAGLVLVALYVIIQWFLQATDITVSYNWIFDGTMDRPSNIRPSFDIRNRSRSRTYWLANIAYQLRGSVHWFDNSSLWNKELPPGTIHFFNEVSPIPRVASLTDCTEMQVTVRLQNGRVFWLGGQGPGQQRMGRIQSLAFRLRAKLEAGAVPME